MFKTDNMTKFKNGIGCKLIDNEGVIYNSITKLSKSINSSKKSISSALKKFGEYRKKGKVYKVLAEEESVSATEKEFSNIEKEEFKHFLSYKKVEALPFERYNINFNKHSEGYRYAIALFSDVHIEETVSPASVQYLNEYNSDIAEKRIKAYFANLVSCLNTDRVDCLIFACLGDIISGYIYDELAQTNSLSPLEAIFKAQSLILSGLQFILENTNISKLQFIGIVGNHGRTTKKIQHSNGYKMSYEWLMYKNIETQASLLDLPIDFFIPESEIAVITTEDKKNYIFAHGFQIKGSGTGAVCGIYPALNRLSMRWDKMFHQDKIYIGHFHSCTSIPNATVNGSIIGYNSYALTNGFIYEKPQQAYEVYDSNIGELLNRKIYCE